MASLSQGRKAAAQCGFFTHKSVPVIFEPHCNNSNNNNNNNNNNMTDAAIYGVEATLAPLSGRETKYDDRGWKVCRVFKIIIFCHLKKSMWQLC